MWIRRLIISVLFLTSVPSALATGPERIAVIVRADRTVEAGIDDVAQIYLKKRRFWPDRRPILPVNRQIGSREREAFTRNVFADIARGLPMYWNRQYFRGVLPPPTLASDEAVKRYIALEENAIGYVHEKSVDESVRVLFYLDLDPPPRDEAR